MRDFSRIYFFIISAIIALTQSSPAMATPEDSLMNNPDDDSFSELYLAEHLSDFFSHSRAIQDNALFPNDCLSDTTPSGPMIVQRETNSHTFLPIDVNPVIQPDHGSPPTLKNINYSTLSNWNMKNFMAILQWIQPYPESASMLLLGGSLLGLAAYGRKKQLETRK